MTYDKPEVVVLANALSAVKGLNKDAPVHLDANGDGVRDTSINAYEADE